MFSSKFPLPFLHDFSVKLSSLMAASPTKDLERNIRSLFSSALSRLNLVTREEFDIQLQVLLRAGEKLRALEARVLALETRRQDDHV